MALSSQGKVLQNSLIFRNFQQINKEGLTWSPEGGYSTTLGLPQTTLAFLLIYFHLEEAQTGLCGILSILRLGVAQTITFESENYSSKGKDHSFLWLKGSQLGYTNSTLMLSPVVAGYNSATYQIGKNTWFVYKSCWKWWNHTRISDLFF